MYQDYDPYDPFGNGGADSGGGYTPPAAPPYADPPPPDLTGQGGGDPPPQDNRPPKPPDPGDGRVWIWMGDQWGLTVPEGSPFGPHVGPAAGSAPPASAALNYPAYQSAGAFTPRNGTFNFDPFVPQAFTASSWADAEKEPGYDASRTQLRKQVEAGAANRGVLRSGMTLGDIYTNLDALGQQNFKQFDDRRYRNWSGNEADRYQAWSGNLGASRNKFLDEYGIDRDIYDRHATDVDRSNNYNFNAADASFKDALDRWKVYVSSLSSLAQPPP